MSWIEHIDLREYAGNLTDSGVHGALLLLDQHFDENDLIILLQIPASAEQSRQVLSRELQDLIKRGRENLQATQPTSQDNSFTITNQISNNPSTDPSVTLLTLQQSISNQILHLLPHIFPSLRLRHYYRRLKNLIK